jgi:NAD(P)-dependent dehydrogenase (short-subunit alcohol dehydrogenase family)
MPRLADKFALITGGESGIGSSSARLFVEEGARVHLVGLDDGRLAAAVVVEFPSDDFARTLAVHVLGALHIIKHTAPHVPDGGSIVVTASAVMSRRRGDG